MRCHPAIAALLAFGTALAPITVTADTGADSVMAKVRAYLGWTLGDGRIGTMRIQGRLANDSTFDEICEPVRFVQYATGDASGRPFAVTSGQGYARVSGPNGTTNLPGDVAADAFTQSLLLCNAFANYPATIVADIDVAQTSLPKTTELVALSIPNEPKVLLAVDADTGALTSVIIDGIATYKPAGLKNIDATRKIYTIWQREVTEQATADMSISSLQLNVAIDESIFKVGAPYTAPPPDPSPAISL